jgi:pyruvate-formate lyase-activating enzyme
MVSIDLQPPWLVALDRSLQERKLPVREVLVSRGLLRVTFGTGARTDLTALVSPAADGRKGWATTSRFVVGYQGARDLDEPRRRLMSAFVSLLGRIESDLPPAFTEPCAVFADGTHPEERFRRLFSFCTVERSHSGGSESTEVLIRATDRCNLDCPFCSGPPLHEIPSHELVNACIDQAARTFPGAILTLTGGEPTLRPTFFDEVGRALRSPEAGHVQVQTNAIPFEGKLDAADLAPDGRLSFFASLHALDSDIFDRCTGSRGQLGRAVAGIDNLIAAGHPVIVNCVVNSENAGHLADYVRALAERLSHSPLAELHFSTLICPEYRAEAADFLVRYTRIAPLLEEAAEIGSRMGLRMSPLRSSTHASIPGCMLNERYRDDMPRRPVLHERETGYEDRSRPWIKAGRCRDCAETDTCLGVPRPYADKLGLEELRPVRTK